MIAAYFGRMIDRTSKQSEAQTPTERSSQIASVLRPVHIATVNWVGLGTLYKREVQRFMKIAMQSLAAPAITSVLFLMVFSVAIGERASFAGDVDFVTFLVPGLVMMNVLQNAFANTSSSLVISKVQGNVVDLLLPPLGPGELLFGLAAAGITRGLVVGIVTALVLVVFGGGATPPHPLIALGFLILGACAMSFAGIIAGIWANKFDELAAITNFVVQPLTFLSGTFYSVDRLPAPFDVIASLNPVFYTIDGFRYGMAGLADRPLLTGLSCLITVNVILAIFCYKALHSGYRLKS
ncbi:ABC transporter permease [Candidatus Puniceispirillum sp.]|nr:ABC transporter permease [Candidatus Puniceispirillum sp.]